ncbi:MAG: metallophosphoesterase [Deltaproteobacteria bacterium]|nr:metallophosphoesterase [Deltaproteobacteria bacterium]
MNLLHISDLHFGPRHWTGNDGALLEKLNSYKTDIVINTGDSTSDGLENEYTQAQNFLSQIKCEHVISAIGNHDKRNMRAQEFFKEFIYDTDMIYPVNEHCITKKNLFLNRNKTKIKDNFTDINFMLSITIKGKIVLVIVIDTSVLSDNKGFVEVNILKAISEKLKTTNYDMVLLLTHYPILGVEGYPLANSQAVIDFVNLNRIKYVFSGHCHNWDLRTSRDLITQHQFAHFKCGTTASCNLIGENQGLIFYENLGEKNCRIHLTHIFPDQNKLQFREEIFPCFV